MDTHDEHTIHIHKVEWQGVSCSYKVHRASKVVLQDVWGAAMAGEVQVSSSSSSSSSSRVKRPNCCRAA
jgi:hypothetical protein